MKEFFDILSYLINIVVVGQWAIDLRKKYLLNRSIKYIYGEKSINIYMPTRLFEVNRIGYSNEDFYAATVLSDFLHQHHFKTKYISILVNKSINFQNNSIIICGPKSSESVAALIKQDPFYGIHKEGEFWKIIDKKNNISISSPIDVGGDRDLSYVSILRRNKNSIILIAGIHAIGSYGAASYLINDNNLKILNKFSKENNLSFVTSSKFGDDNFLYESEIFLQVKEW